MIFWSVALQSETLACITAGNICMLCRGKSHRWDEERERQGVKGEKREGARKREREKKREEGRREGSGKCLIVWFPTSPCHVTLNLGPTKRPVSAYDSSNHQGHLQSGI